MIELPEASVLSWQLNETILKKKIRQVIVAQSPHKFAWYHEDPGAYHDLLAGKKTGSASAFGSWIEIMVEDAMIAFCEGIHLRFHQVNEKRPQKHQLLIEFEDLTALSASVQMYGGLYCCRQGRLENEYYLAAKEKPPPLSDRFDKAYFQQMLSGPEVSSSSAKAFLASHQRIPGLGNGVLQDILFAAKIHPKRKMDTLQKSEQDGLFGSIKGTLVEMVAKGGRDTEKDLFGNPGGYQTKASKNALGRPCPECGGTIKKESYMGGSIYTCPACQPL